MADIVIRNVPDKLHQTLQALAAHSGISLSQYVLRVLERGARKPTVAELRARLATRSRVHLPVPAAQVLAEERAH